MSRLISLLGAMFLYFCVGTVLAQSALVLVLWQRGAFTDGRVMRMWAALHGVDLLQVRQADAKQVAETSSEQPAYEEVVLKRATASLDIDLRENALDKALGQLRAVETKIKTERSRFDTLVDSFDLKLKELETNATNQAVLETQQTLEALPAKQAKQQLLKLLTDKASEKLANPRESVVALVKAMPIERRRKILAEFKTEEEGDQLASILKDILSGAPDVPLLRQSKADLQRLNPNSR